MSKYFIALILNVGLTLWSMFIFLNKGIEAGPNNWKFYASLLGALVFFVFTVLVFLQTIKSLKTPE